MSTYKNRTTPGVYITELDAFPRSVPGVQTAVPAFIGYTAKASIDGKPAYFHPVRINSFADYQAVFGGGYDPVFDVAEVTPIPGGDNYDFVSERWDATAKAFVPKYYAVTRSTSKSKPESEAEEADDEEKKPPPPLATFNLYQSVNLFYANGGGPCYIVSVGTYTGNGNTPGGVAVDPALLEQGLAAIAEQTGPTMLVIPDAVLLAPTDPKLFPPVSPAFNTLCRDMLAQCAKLQDRVAILDVYGTHALNTASVTFDNDVIALIDSFQTGVGENYLNYGMAYFPFLVTSLISSGEIDYWNFNIDVTAQFDLLKGILDDEAAYLNPDPNAKSRDPNDNKNPTYLKLKEMVGNLQTTKNTPEDLNAVRRLNQNIGNALPLLSQIENVVAYKMSLLPTSGAMAGVYSFNDASRGVWNAPANIVLNSVVSTNVKINADLQGQLNIPINGKAINVIREFVGRGSVVWGARTLDGNSNDWRYIQVRRTLVYIEQSVKTALNQFVFAPNNGTTWVAVTAMVSNFLQNLWSQGGLMGDKASDAFTVQCGLGSTMTGMDILQGYMVVQVTLQMIRPAEFIELTFKQKMEGVG